MSLAVACLSLLPALGASRLTYHEAIWSQSAREMLASGAVLIPTLDGRPWLEKPPLGTWGIAASGWAFGGLSEWAARLPSALAAVALTLGVATIAARGFGAQVGLLAGMIQATTAWAVLRGRLAESDVILAALVVWAMAALDRVRAGSIPARWAFFALIGSTALAKGIGFGAVLVVATGLALAAWDRDWRTLRALINPVGVAASLLIASAWPLATLARHPRVMGLWTAHVAGRLSPHSLQFAAEGWGEYGLGAIVQTLPWTPLAVLGAWGSARRAIRERGGPDRLLWAWAAVPAVLVSCASARNGHYLIYALPPAAIWAAFGLVQVGERLRDRRAWSHRRLRVVGATLFAAIGLAWGGGFWAIGPRLNPRDAEFAFYAKARDLVGRDEALVLLYDLDRDGGWDKQPYPTPFGPVPSDLAARLFYLDRPASWRRSAMDLQDDPPRGPTFAAVGRERDADALGRLGRVEILARGPANRWDRAFVLFRVTKPTRIAGR